MQRFNKQRLAEILDARGSAIAGDVAQESGFSRGATRRQLNTLVRSGHVRQSERSPKVYALTAYGRDELLSSSQKTYAMISKYQGKHAIYVRHESSGASGRAFQNLPSYAHARDLIVEKGWTPVKNWGEAA